MMQPSDYTIEAIEGADYEDDNDRLEIAAIAKQWVSALPEELEGADYLTRDGYTEVVAHPGAGERFVVDDSSAGELIADVPQGLPGIGLYETSLKLHAPDRDDRFWTMSFGHDWIGASSWHGLAWGMAKLVAKLWVKGIPPDWVVRHERYGGMYGGGG